MGTGWRAAAAPGAVLVVLLAAGEGARAWPTSWTSCQPPTRGWGTHKDPVQDDSITFTLQDCETGEMVTEAWVGRWHLIRWTTQKASRGILFASQGEIDYAEGCGGRKLNLNSLEKSFEAEWKPTSRGTGTLTVNMASGSTAPYRQAALTVAVRSNSTEPAPPAPRPAPAPAAKPGTTPPAESEKTAAGYGGSGAARPAAPWLHPLLAGLLAAAGGLWL